MSNISKTILGLDLGTNSIGWALIQKEEETNNGKILGLGSRIIPMSQDILNKFDAGKSHSQTANRTSARSVRKLYQRDNLRRERLHRALNLMGFLPEHYASSIDFESHKGQFINYSEPKLAYHKIESGKHQFLFLESFNEMVKEFETVQPDLFSINKKGKRRKIPYDWTIYYLRKKALSKEITKEELSWLILHFNQKRGYYQLSEMDEKEENLKLEEYHLLAVTDVIESEEKSATGDLWFKIVLENGWQYLKSSKTSILDWVGKKKEFIVTTEYNEDGSPKLNQNGEIKRTFRSPDDKDWGLRKKRTESEIEKSGKTVGEYIFEQLLINSKQKIRGKLIQTIERHYYKKEFEKILIKQSEFHGELRDPNLYQKCILELYPNNEAHRKNIEKRGFVYLIKDDILFYQRPLKTKKYLISECSLEYRIRRDTNEKVHLKCIAKSNPLFQEFRLWQFISNLRIIEREKTINGRFAADIDVTAEYISNQESWANLFDNLNEREEITQKQFLAIFKLKEDKFRWNHVEKPYPCNETKFKILNRIRKITGDKKMTINDQFLARIWHILYSVTDPEERQSAITKFAQSNGYGADFIESFIRFPAFKRDYGSFSEKAIKKLLPLLRRGKYWNWESIDSKTKLRIDKVLTGEYDEGIGNMVRNKSINLISNNDFQGLPMWLASYVVYDRHSEVAEMRQWKCSDDIADFLNPRLKGSFKQHSLRNPIVEQVITETLRVVKDIWDEFGNGEEGFFDEIHLELGREMKNDQQTRENISKRNQENENTNERIRKVLIELKNDIQDVRPYSPSQQEILKLYEEGVYQNELNKVRLEEIDKIRKNVKPSSTEIQRYKLWLEQGYISPYTRRIIKLSELFSTRYQIEHIFPQARYFDDSLSNKIICESAVNKLKDNLTAFEFISSFGGALVDLGEGQQVKILTLSEYEEHIKNYFSKNRLKREHLLSNDIPDSFINRQMNDSRYISKYIKNLLANIVREENEPEATTKKLIPVTGAITSKMKHDWGLNDVWNELITPRFIRLNEMTNSQNFGFINPNTNKFLPQVPEELAKGFSKKRIDHRHHALDALVIACITRSHVNYLNHLNARNDEEKNLRADLRNKLCYKTKTDSSGNYTWDFNKPWETFTQDAKYHLENTIISFKQNLRVINKTKNKIQKWKLDNGQLKKKLVSQIKGDNWAIRKSLHKASVDGKVVLKRDGNIVEASARRISLNDKFSRKNLDSITDTGIQKILNNHVKNYIDEKGIEQLNLAFNPDGIESLNQNIVNLNNGKYHQPIYSVRVSEISQKFSLGYNGSKRNKYVEADKGTNLFFAVYWNEEKQKREFETIPLNEVIAHQKLEAQLPRNQRTAIPVNVKKGSLLFVLSPNDLVYVPKEDSYGGNYKFKAEIENSSEIYKMVSSSGNQAFFVAHHIGKSIVDKVEFSALNKMEKDINGIMIKNTCVKIKVSRVGKILN